ncbi:MAG: hypothetical protein IH593_14695, partial [Bacteroidales bacterium]|nr:hypothetical protein [Bacteroidales bacterium]
VTVVTGVSGSGKSSLVYGTLYAESQRRFLEGVSSYSRQFRAKAGIPLLRESHGLVPAISLKKKNTVKNPRSTIATYTGLYDLYRLLFSRLAKNIPGNSHLLSGAFSFNAQEGACPVCRGLGTITVCDADRIVTNPEKPITSGALDGTKTGRFYGDPNGQYIAALLTAGKKYGIDYSVPFMKLSESAKETALNGCGEELFEVDWKYKRGAHVGTHKLKTTWPGFLKLVETEYFRKHDDARGDAMLALMKLIECDNCHGFRLRPEILRYRIRQKNIGEVTGMTADDALIWFTDDFTGSFKTELEKQAAASFRENICEHLEALQKAGLGYIATGRTVG